MSESKNFNDFLHALDEIEGQQRTTDSCDCPLNTTNEKHSDRHDKQACSQSKVVWESETRKSKFKRKPLRYSLQRPGFIYKKKNLTNSSYLDNNFWEYTRGRQVFKSPSFKYKAKVKSLAAHSTMILEDMCNLSLNTKPLSPIKQSSGADSVQTFLPLTPSTSLVYHSSPKSLKKCKSLLSPSRFVHKFDQEHPDKSLFTSANLPETTFHQLASNSNMSHRSKYQRLLADFEGSRYQQILDGYRDPSNNKETEDQDVTSPTVGTKVNIDRSCSYEARMCDQDFSTEELSLRMEDTLFLPKKMSSMAEMMYT